jgi:membrane protein DedA with SNARE-associated domain
VFAWLYELMTEAPTAYVLVLLVAAGDAFLPLLPSETLLILGGVQAGQGDLALALVAVAGAIGAFVGDNVSYWIGRGGGRPLARRLERRRRFKERLDWAKRRLHAGGGYLVPISRFIPGGRTAVTFSAGALSMGWPRFLVLSLIGACAWASYSSLVGYFGGRMFAHSEWKALLLAFGIALAVAGAIEAVRRVRA